MITVITKTKTNGIQIHICRPIALKMSTIMNVTSVTRRCALACSLNITGSKVVTFSRETHYMWKLHGIEQLFVVCNLICNLTCSRFFSVKPCSLECRSVLV